ncbi:MAG TPA: MMPL family transporter [Kofleriaceae bacterium]
MISERFVRWIVRHRRAVLAAIVVASAIAAYSARRIEIRFAFRDFFDYPANPELKTIDRYHDYFEDPAGFVAIVVESSDVFDHATLDYVATLTRALEPSKLFSHVRSLVNAKATRWTGDSVDVGLLLATQAPTAAEAERARQVAHDSVLVHRVLVADDSRSTIIAAQLATAPTSCSLEDLRVVVAVVRAAVTAHPPPAGIHVRITGAPVLEVEASDALLFDQKVFTPIAIALIVLALVLAFRCVHGIVLPVIAISVAALWTAGLFPLFGRPVDMIASTIPATLLVYGAVDPIFVLRRYLDKLRAGLSKEDAIVASYRELTLPCFLASFTTAIGFAAFGTLDLPMIVAFGRVMAIGVLLAFATTLLVLPALLAVLPVPSLAAGSTRLAERIDRFMVAWWHWLQRRRAAVLVAAVALFVAGALFATRQTVSLFYTRILPPGQTDADIRFVENNFTGVIRSALFLEGPADSMKDPKVLAAIARVEAVARGFRVVTVAISLADVVAEMNRAFMEGDPKENRVPASANLSSQYMQMLDPGDRARLVTEDFARSHVMIFTRDYGTAAWRPMRDAVMAAVHRELAPLGISAHMTEENPAGFDVLDPLVGQMVWGFALAFVLVVVFIAIILRSIRCALITVIPNLVPVVTCFLFTAAAGITLRVGTVLFLSVSIGGLFNTAIQFLARVQQRRAADPTATPDAIVEESMREVGPPALFTAVILSAGFVIFTLSRFPDLRVFGVLAMNTLLIGFLSDMTYTTTLTRMFYRWRR